MYPLHTLPANHCAREREAENLEIVPLFPGHTLYQHHERRFTEPPDMKITCVSAYRADLPYAGGTDQSGPRRVLCTGESTVVIVDTDAGLSGCGESCPIGSNHLAAYPEGIATALVRLAPALLGCDLWALHLIERSRAAMSAIEPGEIAHAGASTGIRGRCNRIFFARKNQYDVSPLHGRTPLCTNQIPDLVRVASLAASPATVGKPGRGGNREH
jgi:hypothetical protein